jgi:hypothetical protein
MTLLLRFLLQIIMVSLFVFPSTLLAISQKNPADDTLINDGAESIRVDIGDYSVLFIDIERPKVVLAYLDPDSTDWNSTGGNPIVIDGKPYDPWPWYEHHWQEWFIDLQNERYRK